MGKPKGVAAVECAPAKPRRENGGEMGKPKGVAAVEHRFEVNRAYLPYLAESGPRVQIFFGGAASGKSTFLAQRVVWDLMAGRNYLVLRQVARTLSQSVYNQVAKEVRAMGLSAQFSFQRGEMTARCLASGAEILFAGLDDVEKLKSVTPSHGVFTDIWVEEATELRYEDYKQLTKRLRGRAGVEKRITLSFNPLTKGHWIYRRFFTGWAEGQRRLVQPGLLIVKTTWRDNAFLEKDDVEALLSEDDPYFYRVYTEGDWGLLGGRVFTRWCVEDLAERKKTADEVRSGLDFGFANDPNALLRVQVDMRRKKLYVLSEMLQAGLHDDELAEEVKKRVGGGYVTCDCEDPKAISDLCRRGVRALPAVKGPDSLRFGIRFLQGFDIIVDKSCVHFRREIESYAWAKDKYGNILQRPVDKDNHLLDALRYAVEDLMLQSRAEAAARF